MRRQPAILIFGFGLLLLSGTARAVLPPDAATRAPQIRSQHYYARQAYNQRLKERRAEAVVAYERTQTDIFTPPWMRSGLHTAFVQGADSAALQAVQNAQKRKHRLLASIMLLILIGAAVVWVRHTTREIDKNDL